MIVLKIIGFILLGILALVVLALCVRIRFRIEYSNENTSVAIKWLFLNLPIYPTAKKEKKETTENTSNEEEKTEDNAEQQDEPKNKKEKTGDSFLKTLIDAEGVDGILAILKKVMSYTKSFFGGMLRAFIIDEFYLDIRCTRSDAASTAIYYGEVCAAVFPLLGSLASKYRIKKYDVRVYPDYIARFSDASFAACVHITPLRLIGTSFAYALKLLFGVIVGLVVKIFGAVKSKNDSRNDNTKTNIKEKSDIK